LAIKHTIRGVNTMQAQRVLHKLLDNTCGLMHQARRLALAANVMAALSGTRLTVTALHQTQRPAAIQPALAW
jgi:hypothetical protein